MYSGFSIYFCWYSSTKEKVCYFRRFSNSIFVRYSSYSVIFFPRAVQDPLAERRGQDLLPGAGQDAGGRLCSGRLCWAQIQDRQVQKIRQKPWMYFIYYRYIYCTVAWNCIQNVADPDQRRISAFWSDPDSSFCTLILNLLCVNKIVQKRWFYTAMRKRVDDFYINRWKSYEWTKDYEIRRRPGSQKLLRAWAQLLLLHNQKSCRKYLQ
jgi:hypothetical protein